MSTEIPVSPLAIASPRGTSAPSLSASMPIAIRFTRLPAPFYVAVGLVAWGSLLFSGVDAVVAGLAIGLVAPAYTPGRDNLEAAAVRFLNENAFATPSWAVKADILRRIEAAGALARVNLAQERVLNSLLSNARFDRLVEQEAIDGMAAYKPADFMADVRRGIWSELEGAGPVRIDVYRRNLQNSYIDLLSNKLNVRPSVTDDYRALIKAELRDLSAALAAASARATDRQTRAHLADARDQIAKALDPKFAPPSAPATFTFPFGFDDEFSSHPSSNSLEDFDYRDCWPDYAVRIRPREQ